jgi:hypothetical protein
MDLKAVGMLEYNQIVTLKLHCCATKISIVMRLELCTYACSTWGIGIDNMDLNGYERRQLIIRRNYTSLHLRIVLYPDSYRIDSIILLWIKLFLMQRNLLFMHDQLSAYVDNKSSKCCYLLSKFNL